MKSIQRTYIILIFLLSLFSIRSFAQDERANIDSLHKQWNSNFHQVSNSLEDYTTNKILTSQQLLDSLVTLNKSEKVIYLAKDLHYNSNILYTWIADLKEEIILATGGTNLGKDSVIGIPVGLKDSKTTDSILIGPEKNGKAYELKVKLDRHIDYLNELSISLSKADTNNVKPLHFPMLALDGRDDPLFKNNQDYRYKDFARLNFEQTPMVASIAFLSEKQSKIVSYEYRLMNYILESIE